MEMLASPGCNTALSGQPVKAAAGASLEVALTGWDRVIPHRKNDWPKKNPRRLEISDRGGLDFMTNQLLHFDQMFRASSERS